jgi:hypothetical protein
MLPSFRVMRRRPSYRTVLLLFAIILSMASNIGFIWAHRFLPLQDYPNWLYQGFVFSRLLAGSKVSLFTVRRFPVPNSMTTFAIGVLCLIFAPENAGRVALTIYVMLFSFGGLYLLSTWREWPDAIFLLPFVYSLNALFFLGNINNVLGIVLFFIYGGFLLRRARLESSHPFELALFLCVIFLTHLLPFVLAVLLTVAVLLTASKSATTRSVLFALLPSFSLLAWYTVERARVNDVHVALSLQPGHVFTALGGQMLYNFSLLFWFPPWLAPNARFGIIAAAVNVLASGLAWFVVARSSLSLLRGGWSLECAPAACGLVAVGVFFLCPQYFGGIYYPGGRFLLPALFLVLVPPTIRGSSALLTTILCAAVLVQSLYQFSEVTIACDGTQEEYRALERQRSYPAFCSIFHQYVDSSIIPRNEPLRRFIPSFNATLAVPYYLYIERNQVAPIFPTSLLEYHGDGDYNALCDPHGTPPMGGVRIN